jgi:hypothetical protein
MTLFKTPLVPDWVRRVSHPRYRNIYSFGLGNQNLWGTETLLGDWDGEHLLVAKDFYPSSYIAGALGKGEGRPYAHNPAAPTNRNLIKTLRHFGRFSEHHDNRACNFLYISACFLLRDDGEKRGALPDMKQALSLSLPVVKFTMDRMPNLKAIILMGREAETAFQVGGLAAVAVDQKLRVHRVAHPANAMSDVHRFEEWGRVFR